LLIHDLYQRNVKLKRELPTLRATVNGQVRPFKIVYAEEKIEADTRSFEKIRGAVSSDESEGLLFKYLGMPKSTSGVVPPLAITGTNEELPYVVLWGAILIDGVRATVTVGDKYTKGNKISSPLATVSLDASGEKERKHCAAQKTIRRRALSGYSVAGMSLEEAYVKSAMFKDDGDFVLPKNRVKEVCDVLFNHMVAKLQNHISESVESGTASRKKRKSQSMLFRVFVLPSKGSIKWDYSVEPSEMFVDVFGAESTEHARDKPTFNCRFLSIDDPSFIMKCRTNWADLYDDLGLSKKSHMQINLHDEDLFKLSGLFWYFGTDIVAKNRKRQRHEDESDEQEIRLSGIKKHGIYAQIRDMAEANWDDHRIMCLSQDKAKVEILFDENCVFSEIRERLVTHRSPRVPPKSLETLILEDRRGRDWGLYMEAVRALLHGRKVARHRILSRLMTIMYKSMREMRGKTSAAKIATSQKGLTNWFERGLYCLEAIADGGGNRFAGLEDDEHFAHCVGQAAMHFASLRSGKSPTKDALLTFPVYDRATLRTVLSKVVSGLALRLDDPKAASTRAKCARAISWVGGHEIPDRGSRTDLSYFFHAGAFSVIGSTSRGKEVEDGAGAG